MKVEIWSDVICPWCYIGKRRFESALSRFPHSRHVEVVWRSFELDPGAPQQHPGTLDQMLADKYGIGLEQAEAMNSQVSELALAEGLDYRLDDARPGNTFDAHRLLHYAATKELRAEAKERLLRAYFNEGKPIGELDTLVSLAGEIGLDSGEVRSVLESDAFSEEVRADEVRARALGANGVPFFVFDERYGVSGAQPADLLLEVLQKAWETAQPVTLVGSATGDAAHCDNGAC